jgi:hypothetical protein
MRSANAVGTALGYPDPVKPLIPRIDPGWIRAAASSALITSLARVEFKILELVAAMENYLPFSV